MKNTLIAGVFALHLSLTAPAVDLPLGSLPMTNSVSDTNTFVVISGPLNNTNRPVRQITFSNLVVALHARMVSGGFGVITNGQTNVTLGGVFSGVVTGNGNGLTNLAGGSIVGTVPLSAMNSAVLTNNRPTSVTFGGPVNGGIFIGSGVGLVALQGQQIQAGSLNFNSFDAPTLSLLAGSHGVTMAGEGLTNIVTIGATTTNTLLVNTNDPIFAGFFGSHGTAYSFLAGDFSVTGLTNVALDASVARVSNVIATSNATVNSSVNLGGLSTFRDKVNNRQFSKMMTIGDSYGAPNITTLPWALRTKIFNREGFAGAGLMNSANQMVATLVNTEDRWFQDTYGKSYGITDGGSVTWSNATPNGMFANQVGVWWKTTNALNAQLLLQVATNGGSYVTIATLDASNSTPVQRYTNLAVTATNYLLRVVAANATVTVLGSEMLNTNSTGVAYYTLDAGGYSSSDVATFLPAISNIVVNIHPDLLCLSFLDVADIGLPAFTNNIATVYRSLKTAVGSGKLLVIGPWRNGLYDVTPEIFAGSVGAQSYGWTFYDSSYDQKSYFNATNQGWMDADTNNVHVVDATELDNAMVNRLGLSFAATNTLDTSTLYPRSNPSNYVAGITTDTGTNQVGVGAVSYGYGTAFGEGADAHTAGASAGRFAYSYNEGVALGYFADGHDHGSSIGKDSIAFSYGAAFGLTANGKDSGAAFGYGSVGTNLGTAFGEGSYATGEGSFSIGRRAKLGAANYVLPTGQLGMGTNSTDGSLQFRSYPVIDASGALYQARLPATVLTNTSSGVTLAAANLTLSPVLSSPFITGAASIVGGISGTITNSATITNSGVWNFSGLITNFGATVNYGQHRWGVGGASGAILTVTSNTVEMGGNFGAYWRLTQPAAGAASTTNKLGKNAKIVWWSQTDLGTGGSDSAWLQHGATAGDLMTGTNLIVLNGVTTQSTNTSAFTGVSLITNLMGRDAVASLSAGTAVTILDTNGNTVDVVGLVGTLHVPIPLHANMRLSGTSMTGVFY